MDDPTTDPAASFFPDEAQPDLYGALGLKKEDKPDEKQIKMAYRRAALLYHPDKLSLSSTSSEKEAATLKFQQVGFAYSILSSPSKRTRYDATGLTSEGSGLDKTEDQWREFFKELWTGEVNGNTIDEFKAKYQGSEEEISDLFTAYTLSSGSMDHILSHVLLASTSDEARFTSLINQAILEGKLEETQGWKESLKDDKARGKRKAIAKKEAKEAEELAKELGVHDQLFGASSSSTKGGKSGTGKGKKAAAEGDEDALRALIQKRQASRMEGIEARYAALEAEEQAAKASSSSSKKGGKGKKKRTSSSKAAEEEEEEEEEEGKKGKGKKKAKLSEEQQGEEPTEEEFERIQKELLRNKGTKGKGKSSNGGGGGGSKRK